MNKMVVIPIGIVIAIIIGGVVVITSQETNTMEIEDTLDKVLRPTEKSIPEIQEKLDEIEKINLENEYSPKDREWITSGPFQIDRTEYILGEKIFLVIGELSHDEKGQVAFLKPLNSTHNEVYIVIPFDGSEKSAFNFYIEPDLSATKGYCSIDDLVGDWKVVFRGTNYPNLEFKVTEEILPGDEEHYEPVC
jgi:hypothetical protein